MNDATMTMSQKADAMEAKMARELDYIVVKRGCTCSPKARPARCPTPAC